MCGNTAPVLAFQSREQALAGVAVLNSLIFDWQVRRIVAGLHLNKFYLEALAWPRLRPQAVSRLAHHTRKLACLNSRSASLLFRSEKRFDETEVSRIRHECHVEIEVEIAKAFGLSDRDLAVILTDSRDDRRGFWRFFDAEPWALYVRSEILSRLRKNTRASSRHADLFDASQLGLAQTTREAKLAPERQRSNAKSKAKQSLQRRQKSAAQTACAVGQLVMFPA